MTSQNFIKGHGCFYDSLANLLLLSGDEETARRVLENSKNYYLKIGENGICLGTQTRAVRDLTEGMYAGRSVMHPLTQEIVERIQTNYSNQAQDIFRIVKEEFELGNIVPPDSEVDFFDFIPPVIVFIDEQLIKVRQRNGNYLERTVTKGHAILQIDDDTFIDSGRVINYNLDDLTPTAFMSVERR